MTSPMESIIIEPCPEARDAEATSFVRGVFQREFAFEPDSALDKDFESLCGHYRRGRGEVWIAHINNRIIATTALLDLTLSRSVPAPPFGGDLLELATAGGDAELKRMLVVPEARGQGLGRKLLNVAIAHARLAAFDRVVLDSTRELTAALTLYRSFGFEEIPSYNHNPRADIFMALRLE